MSVKGDNALGITTRFGRAFAAFQARSAQAAADTSHPDPEAAEGRELEERVSASELAGGNFDVVWAACRALEATARIEARREQLATLHGAGPFRLEALEALPELAMSAAHAHSRYLAAIELDELLESAASRAYDLRELLIAHTQVAALHGLVEAARAREFQGGHGYQAVAAELVGLAELWSGLWPHVAGRTLLTEQHLIEAECRADQLLVAVSALGQDAAQADIDALRLARDRAEAAFVTCYGSIRAALTFLFHKEDSGVHIAPALTPRDQRMVRIAQLERAMTITPREQWDPSWEAEFERLYYRSSR